MKMRLAELEPSIPERFEQMVALYPDRLAVKSGERALTYEHLNQAANRLARAILGLRGPGREPIALLFDHGLDVVVAILGVLKAGKFYVALDATFPQETVETILNDSRAALIITHGANAGQAQGMIGHERELFNLDELDGALPADNLSLPLTADDLAAIIYTSGSTGEPKGVLHTHRSYLLGVLEDVDRQGISADDRLSLLHPVSFKSATSHLVFSLMSGACLVPYDAKSQGLHGFADWLRGERITLCHLPPAMFRAFAEALNDRNDFPDLRRICLSGSVITSTEFEGFRAKIGGAALLEIGMGCTEAGWATWATLGDDFIFPAEGNPVGYPYASKKILIFDDEGREVGPGEIGEIAVKSRYLAPGYWRNPDLTRAKFLADPKGGQERIYLTGDLGRIMPDGFVIHLGRKDLTVKLRGYRVEIGALERTLRTHPSVIDVGVAVRDLPSGEQHLAAFIVPSNSGTPKPVELRAFLKGKLPDFMIPSRFMVLSSLPMTNGKLDRKKLPDLDNQRPELNTAYMPPRDEIERKLVEIWEDIFYLHPVGVNDPFVGLGGHSLLAMRIISKVNETFGIDLALRSLLDVSTVAGLAGVVASLCASKSRSTAKPADAANEESGDL
jgi:amino acid adenylation domain-containing protein